MTTTTHQTNATGAGSHGVSTISTSELKGLLDRGEAVSLVNVLTPEWVAKSGGARIPGSHWIPVDEVEAKFPLLFAKDEPIVVYCGGLECPLGNQAAQKLGTLGFTNVREYSGGLKEWKGAGLPLESASGKTAHGSCGSGTCA